MRRCSIVRNRLRRGSKTPRPTTAGFSIFGTRVAVRLAPENRATSHAALRSRLQPLLATAFNPDTAHFAARGFSGVTVIAEGRQPSDGKSSAGRVVS